jgi:hypothetical protein
MGPARKASHDYQPAHRMFAMPERDDEKMFSPRLLDGTLSERSRQGISTIAGSRYLDTEGARDYSLNQEILLKSKQKHRFKSEACTDCARDWQRIGVVFAQTTPGNPAADSVVRSPGFFSCESRS